ncbi:hypothetical protein TELCIR_03199 [Teladorsagia circumcincta]|uniref:Protein kinase domain-containing protein n=1 Tax=Teladorsagia circumcincta TaxID=45464 RepID=A0A2G9UX90_TELCI|nr:hypothetical protein TELCIR_03199 [Teladorsagia circumcincta]
MINCVLRQATLIRVTLGILRESENPRRGAVMDIPSTSASATHAELPPSSVQNEDMKKMVQGLKDLMSSRRPPVSRDILKIKMEYRGEKRCIEMDRPVSMRALQDHLDRRYGKAINMYYQQGKGEVVVSIKNQDELDRAIKWDIDEKKLSAQSPRAPTHWKEAKCVDLRICIRFMRESYAERKCKAWQVSKGLFTALSTTLLQRRVKCHFQLKKVFKYAFEQVLLGKTAYGRKADVWSVGVTLVEMLTGKVPWKEFEPMAAMFQIAYEEPRIELPQTVQPVMADLCKVLMNKNFEERPMAAEVLLNHPAFKSQP